MKYGKKLSAQKKKEKMTRLMAGEGVFIYENNTDADLSLPKPSIEGFTRVGPRKRFKGDSYFMSLVKTPICLLKLIEEVKEDLKIEEIVVENKISHEKKEDGLINNKGKKTIKVKKAKRKKAKKGSKTKMKEKLILDQPDVVTEAGKLEQIETEETQVQEEKLLTENPSGDIEIISE
jgi:hypothetical protein